MDKKENKTSFILGILSIVLQIIPYFGPFIGIICGVVGISIKKSETHPTRDIALNVVGMSMGALFFWVNWAIWGGIFLASAIGAI